MSAPTDALTVDGLRVSFTYKTPWVGTLKIGTMNDYRSIRMTHEEWMSLVEAAAKRHEEVLA